VRELRRYTAKRLAAYWTSMVEARLGLSRIWWRAKSKAMAQDASRAGVPSAGLVRA